MRRGVAAFLGLAALGFTSCGGGGNNSTSTDATPETTALTSAPTATDGANPTLQQILGIEDQAVTAPDILLPGGADLPAGKQARLPFILLDKGGSPLEVAGDRLTVWVANDATSEAHGPFEARREAIEAPGAALHDETVNEIWVGSISVPDAGPHFVVATYEGASGPSAASAGVQILERESTPAVGDEAPPSDTPTLADVGGDATKLSTGKPPVTSLLEHSVADSLAARAPFVLVFATPQFCTSRLCGPVVDIAARVQQALVDTPMRFIHVEIYKDNDPNQGANEWVQEWRLPTEPWVFVVGADGRVKAKFEGAASERELEAAARAALAA